MAELVVGALVVRVLDDLRFPCKVLDVTYADDATPIRWTIQYMDDGNEELVWRNQGTVETGAMPSAIGIVTLAHAATYYGELDADGRPHGTGCLYFSAGGYYAGSFVSGRKHGPGVCSFPDGSRYEGDFVDDERDGYGVHSVPIGDRYRGQWRSSAQDGVGEVLERSGRLRRGIFQSNAFEAALEHSDDVVAHLVKASEAQQCAFIAERSARASEKTAHFQASMTIDGWYIQTDADLDAYEAEASARQEAASAAWLRDFRSLEAETQEGKTEEATLGETQKQLYLTIQARRKELARLSMFWDVVQDKEKHLAEAHRVLDAVEREIAAEVAWANANKDRTTSSLPATFIAALWTVGAMNKSHRSPLRAGARSIYAGLLDILFVTAHVLVGYGTYASYDWATTELYPLGATLLAAPVLPPPSLCRTLFSTPSLTNVHIQDAPRDGIFVMRNGANVGRAMTWVSVGAPGDDCVAPFSRAAAHVLGVSGPDVFAPITLYDDAGHEIAPHFSSIVAAKRVHLLLHGEVWVWPGITVGHEWTTDGYVMRTLSLSPKVIFVRDFLNDSECSALVEGGRDLLGPSHTVDNAANHRLALRTSSTAFIGHVAAAKTIKERATKLARLPGVSYTEDLQLVRYGPGQWYKKHTDYFQHLDVSSHARAGTSLAHWVRWVQAQIGRTTSLTTTHPLYPSLSSAFERSFALLLLQTDAIQDEAVALWLRQHLEHEYVLSSLLAAWSPTNPLLFAQWRRVWEDAVGIPALQWRDPLQHKYVEPNRHATLFLYLNDVAHGGETVFPYGNATSTTSTTTMSGMPECARGLSVKPTKRAGVLFYNKAPTGENDPRSMHGGCPPHEGATKWGSNVFMWNVDAAYGNQKWRFW